MTQNEVAAVRKLAILKNEPVVAKGRCHYCAFAVPPKAIYCCIACAQAFEKERASYLAES